MNQPHAVLEKGERAKRSPKLPNLPLTSNTMSEAKRITIEDVMYQRICNREIEEVIRIYKLLTSSGSYIVEYGFRTPVISDNLFTPLRGSFYDVVKKAVVEECTRLVDEWIAQSRFCSCKRLLLPDNQGDECPTCIREKEEKKVMQAYIEHHGVEKGRCVASLIRGKRKGSLCLKRCDEDEEYTCKAHNSVTFFKPEHPIAAWCELKRDPMFEEFKRARRNQSE